MASDSDSVVDLSLKTKERGSNFYLSLTPDVQIQDLMNPFIGFYSFPTAAYYGNGFPSAELITVIHNRDKSSLPPLLVQTLDKSFKTKQPEPSRGGGGGKTDKKSSKHTSKQTQKQKQIQIDNKTNNLKSSKRDPVRPAKLCVGCNCVLAGELFSKTQYNKVEGRCVVYIYIYISLSLFLSFLLFLVYT